MIQNDKGLRLYTQVPTLNFLLSATVHPRIVIVTVINLKITNKTLRAGVVYKRL